MSNLLGTIDLLVHIFYDVNKVDTIAMIINVMWLWLDLF